MDKETTTEMTFQEECESWSILEKVYGKVHGEC